jgi:branched-chain amino acid transport system permease protein
VTGITDAQVHWLERGIGAVALLALAFAPLLFTDYFVEIVLTQVLWLGIAAASLIFLSAYGGMVSLAQVAIYGIAAFALGNMVVKEGSRGLQLGWDPWTSVVLAILIATAMGFVFGLVASRSTGIYFLMLTLVFSVIVYYFFGQVADLSGFGGVQISRFPGLIGNPADEPKRLFYVALVVAVAVYVVIRLIVRTPFGVSLQGIRDDPIRMASLGYNVALHRTLAFTFAAFLAALAGILAAWYDGLIAPSSIGLSVTLNVLVVAVIGSLYRIEGAWVGAFAFVLITNYIRDVEVPLIGGSFNTIIGLVFLVIVLVSPDGLMGLWDRLLALLRGGRRGATLEPVVEARAAEPGA